MPVVIKRQASPALKPKEEWKVGFGFVARSPSGSVYDFHVIDEQGGIALELKSHKVWWIDPDKRAVRMASSPSVVAFIER